MFLIEILNLTERHRESDISVAWSEHRKLIKRVVAACKDVLAE